MILRPSADIVQFTRESAERISNVVRDRELQPAPGSALTFEPLPESPRKVFRMATYTGAWAKEESKTVTIRGSTATLVAYNAFAALSTATGPNCAIARHGTAWYLIAAEC